MKQFTTPPTLIACSHGTSSELGAAAVSALVDAVRDAAPRVRVVPTFVDVQTPALPEVVADHAGRTAVVVPLLLSSGFHVRQDIATAVALDAGHVAADPLGPHAAIVDLLADRLTEVDVAAEDVVVLGASASSSPQALVDIDVTAAALSTRLGRRIPVGFVGHCGTRLEDVVAGARVAGRRVVVVTHLLAPGHFHRAIARAGADAMTRPLLDERQPDARLVALVLERYHAAAARLYAEAG